MGKKDKFIIQKTDRLCGTVEVSGSKNAAIPILAATLLAEGKSTLNNVPCEFL